MAKKKSTSSPAAAPDPVLTGQLDAISQYKDALEDIEAELESTRLSEEEREKLIISQSKAILQRDRAERKYLNTLKELGKASAEQIKKLGTLEESIKSQTNTVRELGDSFRDSSASFRLGSEAMNDLNNAVGISDNKFSKFYDTVQKNGFSMTSFTKGVKENISYQKVAGSIMQLSINQSIDYGKSLRNIEKQTQRAFGAEQGAIIAAGSRKAAESLRVAGLGYEGYINDTNKASIALQEGMSSFNTLSEAQQAGLSKNAFMLSKLGISNEDYTESMQTMTAAMGLGAKESAENVRELVAFSNKIGKSTASVSKDFVQMKSFLTQFGPNFEKVFQRMEVAVKKTGLAATDLQSIFEGFDTFDSAAESVGKLNALLGGPLLNTVDMLNTEDPAERILKLKDAFDASGKSIATMNRRELQAFAAAVPGINGDTEKLSKLFRNLDAGVLSSADSINTFLEGTEQTTKALEKQVLASATTEEVAQAIKAQFSAPLEDLHKIAEVLGNLQSSMLGFGEKIKYIFHTPVRMFNNMKTFFKGASSFADNIFSKVKSIFSFFGKEGTEEGAKQVAKQTAEQVTETVAKEGSQLAVKEGSKFGIKALGKAAKAIPVIGALPSLFFAGMRAMEGDYVGAGLEVASAGANLGNLVAPGAGSAASLGIDAAILARDLGAVDKLRETVTSEGPKMAAGGIVTKPVENATIGEAGKEAVIPLEAGAKHLVEPLALALKQVMGGSNNSGGTPNITLKVELGGRELTAFVKQVMVDSLNPFS